MQPSSSSSLVRAASLVPFLYFVITRASSAKDIAYHAASSWIPAIWIAYYFGTRDPADAALAFGAGYLCFIAIYEIGYLVNDAWDSYRDPGGRQRLSFRPGPLFIALFVLIRIAVWALIASAAGWFDNGAWLACYAALVLAFAQHNLIGSAGLRSASFFQLSILRFIAPVIAVLDPRESAIALLCAILFYSYLRFLSYLESKKLLALSERRGRYFGLIQTAMLAPTMLFVGYAVESWLPLQLLAYFLVLYLLWSRLAPAGASEAKA